MRWLKPTLNSIYSVLGHTMPPQGRSAQSRQENIRNIMLNALTIEKVTERHHMLVRRIFYATDIQTLWYARSDLMSVLAEELGETAAHDKLRAISELFNGLLPEARHSSQSRVPGSTTRR